MFLLLMFQFMLQAAPVGEEPKVDYVETVNVVRLSMKVTREGEPLRNLALGQIDLKENGRAIPVQDLQEINTPLILHFLFDLSTSNEKYIHQAKANARDFIRKMHKEDKAKISFFSAVYQSLTDYQSDKKMLQKRLSFLTPVGTTALYDGLASAIKELGEEQGNRILVLLSDGHDLMSRTTEAELLAIVKSHRVPILFVPLGKASEQPLLKRQFLYLNHLASVSGGQTLPHNTASNRGLGKVLKELRRRYLVTFTPPNAWDTEKWRSLNVSVKNCNDCSLEYRRAYKVRTLSN